MKTVPERATIGLEPVPGTEPDGLEVVFHGADGGLASGREYDLPPFNPVGDNGCFLPDRVGPD